MSQLLLIRHQILLSHESVIVDPSVGYYCLMIFFVLFLFVIRHQMLPPDESVIGDPSSNTIVSWVVF